jgi:hypothetical protein
VKPPIAAPGMVILGLILAGCAARGVSAQPQGDFPERVIAACGKPLRYPVSDGCAALMASVGPLLKRRSALVMGVWRSCPGDNPCLRIAAGQPACQMPLSGVSLSTAPQLNPACAQLLEADYSCSALLHDPLYGLIQNQMANPRCEDARKALSDFDRDVENVRLQIQWYQTLTRGGD